MRPTVFRLPLVALLLILWIIPAHAQSAAEPVDEQAVELIRQEGLEESEVMEILSWLTDVHGPRLTGSPQLRAASEWVIERSEAWGLQNAHMEAWGPFGRGWALNRFAMHVTAPVTFPVLAYPKAWSPGIDGPTAAEVVIFNPESDEDFAAYEGKLGGKIVLLDEPRDLEEPFEPLAKRRDADDLLTLVNRSGGDSRSYRSNPDMVRRFRMQQQRLRFLADEKPLAILDVGYKGDYGTLFSSGASVPAPPDASWSERPSAWAEGADVIPQITLAVEHYNRLYRLIEKGFPVQAEVMLDVDFFDDDPMEHNVLAEIPGTDAQVGDEVVMLGAHLDSWHAGTGATDNGAGSAVMMEAMRILTETYQALGKQPRRTIRLGLWTGEEQGLHGSRAYVNEHFAEIPGWGQPPTTLKPEHEKLSAYYNLDNGTGKIRGVYLQENEAVEPIFRAWLAPFNDLGAATLTLSDTGGTDHLAFDAAGLPGFQFIQDHVAYSTRTHHSNMDVYDHVIADDLKQAATIIASFVYHTAERAEKLPRKTPEIAEPSSVGGSN